MFFVQLRKLENHALIVMRFFRYQLIGRSYLEGQMLLINIHCILLFLKQIQAGGAYEIQ